MISKTSDADQSTARGSRDNGQVPDVSDSTVKDLVKVFKLLSDETRLRILLYLIAKKSCTSGRYARSWARASPR